MNSNTSIYGFNVLAVIIIIFSSCQVKNTENYDWQYYKSLGDSLVEKATEQNIKVFAEIENGKYEEITDLNNWGRDYLSIVNLLITEEIIIFIDIPYSESGDWNNTHFHFFDKNGILKVYIRESHFFNSICKTGKVIEKNIYSFEEKKLVQKKHEVLNENEQKINNTIDCVFNYRFDYPLYDNFNNTSLVRQYQELSTK